MIFKLTDKGVDDHLNITDQELRSKECIDRIRLGLFYNEGIDDKCIYIHLRLLTIRAELRLPASTDLPLEILIALLAVESLGVGLLGSDGVHVASRYQRNLKTPRAALILDQATLKHLALAETTPTILDRRIKLESLRVGVGVLADTMQVECLDAAKVCITLAAKIHVFPFPLLTL